MTSEDFRMVLSLSIDALESIAEEVLSWVSQLEEDDVPLPPPPEKIEETARQLEEVNKLLHFQFSPEQLEASREELYQFQSILMLLLVETKLLASIILTATPDAAQYMPFLANPSPSILTSVQGAVPLFFFTYSALHVITYATKLVKEQFSPSPEQWKEFAQKLIPWVSACLQNFREMGKEVSKTVGQFPKGGDDGHEKGYGDSPNENYH